MRWGWRGPSPAASSPVGAAAQGGRDGRAEPGGAGEAPGKAGGSRASAAGLRPPRLGVAEVPVCPGNRPCGAAKRLGDSEDGVGLRGFLHPPAPPGPGAQGSVTVGIPREGNERVLGRPAPAGPAPVEQRQRDPGARGPGSPAGSAVWRPELCARPRRGFRGDVRGEGPGPGVARIPGVGAGRAGLDAAQPTAGVRSAPGGAARGEMATWLSSGPAVPSGLRLGRGEASGGPARLRGRAREATLGEAGSLTPGRGLAPAGCRKASAAGKETRPLGPGWSSGSAGAPEGASFPSSVTSPFTSAARRAQQPQPSARMGAKTPRRLLRDRVGFKGNAFSNDLS